MKPTLKHFPFNAMGSFCEIQIFDESRIHAKKIAHQLSAEVSRLELKYSRFRDDSLLTQINNSAGSQTGIKIDSETQSLLEHALNCFEQSNGLFDITFGILQKIWDFKKGIIPSQSQIDKALSLVDFRKVSWKKSYLFMPQGMQIDFGGIVKEYAADSAVRLGRSLGVQHGLINLGGDFSVIGPQPNNKPWSIGISNPKQKHSAMAQIDLLNGGLASSGDYERYFIHEGKRYSHILNPKTDWPNSGLRAVSIAANLCTVAGSIATIAMLLNEEKAKAWLQDSGFSYVYMDSEENFSGFAIGEKALD